MNYFAWNYRYGINLYLKRYLYQIQSVYHNFSPLLLLKTLFAPWKRLIIIEEKKSSFGFDIERWFQNFTFNAISRFIGFFVRSVLLIVFLISFVLTVIIGFIFLTISTVIPVFGIPAYIRYLNRKEIYSKSVASKIKKLTKEDLQRVFTSGAGRYFLSHLGINFEFLLSKALLSGDLVDFSYISSFEELIVELLEKKVWTEEFFLGQEFTKEDFLYAARSWDKKLDSFSGKREGIFSKPSIGLDLLFGYTPLLDKYSVDLGMEVSYSKHLIGRTDSVTKMERILSSKKNVVLVGSPGVGKKTVVMEFARKCGLGLLGRDLSYKRILEFDLNALISETVDINEKKLKLQLVLQEAATAGNIILVLRDLHRYTASQVENLDLTDIFETVLEKKNLSIISISTNSDYERFIFPNVRLSKFFDKVEVVPPTNAEALDIILESANEWENSDKIIITTQSLRKIIEGSEKFITDIPFPQKAMELLDLSVEYLASNKEKILSVEVVNQVLAEKTGVSFARLTEREKDILSNLEAVIHKRLINQERAVSEIGKSLRSRTLQITKQEKPLGSFLFLGPTGVGKTETAKALAEIYYGSDQNILRFDMSQFVGDNAVDRLIGSFDTGKPGELTVAIKNRPASLLLLDEIEKADRDVQNLLLTLLDEGYITDANSKRINCKNLFVICTSNAAGEYIRQQIGNNIASSVLQSQIVDYVLSKQMFSPEFINRFDGVIVYEPLSAENQIKVAELMVQSLVLSVKKKGIDLKPTKEFIEKIAKDGFDPSFGARPMRRLIDLTIGDLIGRAILSGKIKNGEKISISVSKETHEFVIEKQKI